MLRHCDEKVLTSLQCRDIAATSAEEGKAKICQCYDIITIVSRHQTNAATSKAALTVKLHQASNVATSLRHDYNIGCSEKTLSVQCRNITTQCRNINENCPKVLSIDQCRDIGPVMSQHLTSNVTTSDQQCHDISHDIDKGLQNIQI